MRSLRNMREGEPRGVCRIPGRIGRVNIFEELPENMLTKRVERWAENCFLNNKIK